MTKTIHEDVRKSVTTGLIVYDRNGDKVGYVDQAYGEQGWMVVRVSEFGTRSLWVPYRLVRTADMREIFVSATEEELSIAYAEPPARSTSVANVNGRTIATTTEPSGYDGKPMRLHRVDVDEIKELLAVDQRVWTSDEAEVGTIKQLDVDAGYMIVEKGLFSRQHDLLVPLALVAVANRDVGEVVLAVRESDLKRMQRIDPVSAIVTS